MRLPWEQLAMEVIEVSAPELGDKLYPDLEPEVSEALAGWGVVHLVKWALARCPEHLPPSASALVPGPTAARQIARAARFKGNADAYVAALAALPDPVVEIRSDGIRVRGLDRYDAAWGDNHKTEWATYKAAHPDRYPPPGSRRSSAGVPPEIRRPDADTDADADQLPSEAVAAAPATAAVRPQLHEVAPLAVTAPDTPPEGWNADDFWRWAQSKRAKAGLVVEVRRPDSRALSSWYSTAMMACSGDVARLQEAFYAFGDDKHWQQAKPALPFRAFMSQWDQFVPRRANAGT
jgi:hypothetical protein